ncbi:MAG TPA: hypothetical protein VK446_03270 [Methylocystis sp.]|nr:hypothetical protein [Methylocystis sp.]
MVRRAKAVAQATAMKFEDESLQAPREKEEDPAALASYIAEMTAALASLASEAGLPMLAYFLNLARVEAQIHARDLGDRTPARAG